VDVDVDVDALTTHDERLPFKFCQVVPTTVCWLQQRFPTISQFRHVMVERPAAVISAQVAPAPTDLLSMLEPVEAE